RGAEEGGAEPHARVVHRRGRGLRRIRGRPRRALLARESPGIAPDLPHHDIPRPDRNRQVTPSQRGRMSMSRNASIGTRVMVGGVVFTMLLMFVIAVISIRVDSTTLREQMDVRGKSMVGYMAKTSLFYYRNYDLGALEGFMKEITSDPEVAFAVFFDDK